jgi:hypothetical protein
MGKSSLLGVDRAPMIPKGRDIDAHGPSDSCDSGSDVQGELDLGADEIDQQLREGADIGVDRITDALDSDSELESDEPELEGLSELAVADADDDDDEEDESER